MGGRLRLRLVISILAVVGVTARSGLNSTRPKKLVETASGILCPAAPHPCSAADPLGSAFSGFESRLPTMLVSSPAGFYTPASDDCVTSHAANNQSTFCTPFRGSNATRASVSVAPGLASASLRASSGPGLPDDAAIAFGALATVVLVLTLLVMVLGGCPLPAIFLGGAGSLGAIFLASCDSRRWLRSSCKVRGGGLHARPCTVAFACVPLHGRPCMRAPARIPSDTPGGTHAHLTG